MMLPENTGRSTADYAVVSSRTYHIDLKNGIISGFCDGEEAIRQAIYKILATTRLEHIIYSDNYGSGLIDYVGRLSPYVWAEIERTITDALLYDDRIEGVYDFEFKQDKEKKVLYVSFTVDADDISIRYTGEVFDYV